MGLGSLIQFIPASAVPIYSKLLPAHLTTGQVKFCQEGLQVQTVVDVDSRESLLIMMPTG